jgi:transcriptional regulator
MQAKHSKSFEPTANSGAFIRQIDCLFHCVRGGAILASVKATQTRRLLVKETRSDILQGTLDLMVLKTLDGLGPLHGYGIARRIEQVSDGVLEVNQGTIYPALLRLEQRGWIKAEWGVSENNRRAKYYSLTRTGRKQLETETEDWKRISAVIARMLRSS